MKKYNHCVDCGKECYKYAKRCMKCKSMGVNNPRYGVKLFQKTKDKISKSEKGKIISQKQKDMLSIMNTGKNNPNYRNGNRIKGNYPCPSCERNMIREKRRSNIICRQCYDENRRKNKQDRKTISKRSYKKHKEKTIKRQLERYHNNKDKINKKRKIYRNKPEIKARIKIQSKIYNLKPESKEKKRKRERSKKHREKVNKKIRERKLTDKNFATQFRLRRLVCAAFQKYINGKKVMPSKKYGIDYNAIIEYLKPFPEDLKNWHIDHIRPLCSFNFINQDGSINLEEIKEAFLPSNHQWLLAKENLQKNRKWTRQSNLDKYKHL